MKILIVTAGYPTIYNPLDGIFHKDQAEALAEDNQVSVIAISAISIKHFIKTRKFKFGLKIYTEKNVKTYHYTCLNIPFFLIYSILKFNYTGRKILKKYLLHNELPDIVHLQCFEAVLLATYIKKKHTIPYVVTEHSSRFNNNTLPKSVSKYARIAFNESACNITVSEELANKLSELYNKTFNYIPNIIDTDFFTPGKVKKQNYTLINVAGLVDIKNHVLLIDAYKQAVSVINEIMLIIIGDGPLMKDLYEYIVKLNLQDKIKLAGYLSRRQILEHLQSSHCFVLSSKSETFGVAIVEAMSCGLPVISTISSGPKSIIKHNYLGMLSEHTADSLSEKILQVYYNYSKYNPSEIRQYAIENFSKLAVCKSLVNLYKESIKKSYE